MPNRWLHEFFDIMVQGVSGWKIHEWKDKPSKQLKQNHRILRHNEYLEWQVKIFESLGVHENAPVLMTPTDLVFNLKSFPQGSMSFEEATHITHEFLDQVWSTLSYTEKYRWAQTFKYVIESPEEFPNLLMPQDLDLPEFKQSQSYVKSKTISELI